jgi:hypothetical protein
MLLSFGYWGLFLGGVKQLWYEACHWLPSSAEVNNTWSYTSIPSYILIAWCLIKQRNNFTFIICCELLHCFMLCARHLYYAVAVMLFSVTSFRRSIGLYRWNRSECKRTKNHPFNTLYRRFHTSQLMSWDFCNIFFCSSFRIKKMSFPCERTGRIIVLYILLLRFIEWWLENKNVLNWMVLQKYLSLLHKFWIGK